ncbi:hypothetical protein IWX81_000112 [Salinibacterium sp. CAN_S4]|uniref:RICIN domain-containing protein n=1 Tax=Salinibacterium sp. CAN_S4 TaxID=2787727 RepID=UPI0018EFB4EA
MMRGGMLRPAGSRRQSRLPGWRPAAAIGLAIFLIATGTLAGNAYWSAVTSRSATATAATPATTSSGTNGLAVTYKQGFVPNGSVVSAPLLADTVPITINNTGSTPLNFSVSVSGGNAAVTLQLWKRGSTCDATTAPAAGATTGTLSAPPAMPADAVSATAGTSILLCARTTLTGNFADAAGLTITPTMTFTGRVGDNWSAGSGTAFTQTATYNWFRVKHNFSGKCFDANGASTAVGTTMILYPCKAPDKTDNQSFRFEPVGNQFRIYIGNGSGNGPVIAPTLDTTNAQVQLVAKTTTAGALLNRQLWSVVPHGAAGDFQLVNLQNSRCLTMNSSNDLTVFLITACTTSTSTTDATYRSQHYSFVEIP